MIAETKPGIEELTGRAINASVLRIVPRESESALLRVAALAGAGMQIAARSDRPLARPDHMSPELWTYCLRTVDKPMPTPRDHLDGRLAPLLLRIRNGGDCSESSLVGAATMFASWVLATRTWQDDTMRKHWPKVQCFASQALHEWLFDLCKQCGGTGSQELLRGGRTRRPKLYETGRARLVACRACNGTRVALPDIMARIDAINITRLEYTSHGWEQHYSRARVWLNRIAARIHYPLRKQLER